jgi:hypothetical protein
MNKLCIPVLSGLLLLPVPSAPCQTAQELRNQAIKAQAAEQRAQEFAAEAGETEMKTQELFTLEKETVRALQLNNPTFFRRVYSDDFAGTAANGEFLDKQAFLASVQNSATKYSLFLVSDIHVRMYQDTAVVTCLWSYRGTVAGRNMNRQSRVTHVYVYGQRGWQAVLSQETPLPG